MSKPHLLILGFLTLLLIPLVACQQKSESLSLPAKEEIDKLNDWNTYELSAAECPKDYPGYIASGETHGWIFTHKKKLEELGVSVRWNCKVKAYEAVSNDQSSLSICGCEK